MALLPPTTVAASTGITSEDVASLATAAQQALGMSASDLRMPTGDWCGYFIGNRINASQLPTKLGFVYQNECNFPIVLVSLICATKDAGVFYVASQPHRDRLLEIDPRLGENGRMVSRTCAGWTPQPGDILQFTWSNWNQRIFDHGGIVTGVDGDWLTYVDGNSSAGVVAAHTIRKDSPTIIGNIRLTVDGESAPSTQPSTTPSTPPEYFDCLVEIDCVEGQTVNLYYNPGDTSRVDYFDKGQWSRSSYGAKLSDGSTWYRVNVSSLALNRVADLWLKYESSKMTVTDIPRSFEVRIDANGGYASTKYMFVTDGETFGTLPAPTRDGYTFDGWYTSAGSGTQVISSTVVTSSYDESTLYAHWTKDVSALSVNYLEDGNWHITIGEERINLYETATATERSGTYGYETIDCYQKAVLSDGSTRYCASVLSR